MNRQMRFTNHGDMIWAGFQGHLHDSTGDEWANGARTVCVRHRVVRVPRHSSGDWGVAQDAEARIQLRRAVIGAEDWQHSEV